MKDNIAIIGIGYVGLTLAISLAKAGFRVLGIEKNKNNVKSLLNGKAHFYEENLDKDLKKILNTGKLKISSSLEYAKNYQIIFITIGTPINKNQKVELKNLFQICKKLNKILRDKSIVALRSTVMLNTCLKIEKILNKKNKLIYVASCPERTVEGSALKEIHNLPQIIASNSAVVKKKLGNIFKKITKTIIYFDHANQGELLKLIDNSWRDTTFGYANELAKIGEFYNINVIDIIKKIKIKYPRSSIPSPGTVGGPCLTKDSHILIQSVRKINLPIISSARNTNEIFPKIVIDLIKSKIQQPIKNVLFCGLSFKGIPKTDDLRGSMAIPIIKYFSKKFEKARIDCLDNLVSEKDSRANIGFIKFYSNFQKIKKKYDIIILLNNNPYWKKIGLKKLKKKLKAKDKNYIFDYWSSFNENEDNYFAIGAGKIFNRNTKFIKKN